MSGEISWRKSSRSSGQGGACVEVAGLTAAQWRKSTRSSGQGGDCVEVAGFTAVQWHKSTRSSDQGGACVEVAGMACVCEEHSRVIAVRDSKDPDGPVLAFAPAAWASLSRRIKAGTLDLS